MAEKATATGTEESAPPQMEGTAESKGSPAKSANAVPTRFEKMKDGFSGVKKEHPMYQTSAAVYGSSEVTSYNLPARYCGRKRVFMKEFGHAGNYRNNSLNCTRTRSKALPDPSFGGTPFYES